MATFATLGLVMMAACQDLSTFCAAFVSLPALAISHPGGLGTR